MRTIWNGSINFGLVNIPIGLAVAQQRKDTAFRTLHRECGTPIKQKRYCPFHERDVEADELVKGWEFSKGQFVLVEDSDLEAVALQRSQSVDIIRFVPIDQVDPIYFDRTYYLAPAGAGGSASAIRAAPPRHAGGRDGGRREIRPLGQGEPLPHPSTGRVTRPGDALLRRGHPAAQGDRRGGRGDRGQGARAGDGDVSSSRASSATSTRRTTRTSTATSYARCSRQSSRARRSRPRARHRGAGRGSHGGAQAERRPGAEDQGQDCAAKPKKALPAASARPLASPALAGCAADARLSRRLELSLEKALVDLALVDRDDLPRCRGG